MDGTGQERRQTAIQCLVAIARHHGVDLSAQRIVHDHALSGAEPEPRDLVKIAEANGLAARSLRLAASDLGKLDGTLPALVRLANGNSIALLGVRRTGEGERVVVFDPMASGSGMLRLTRAELDRAWGGDVVLLRRRRAPGEAAPAFGLAWFLPDLLRQKGIFRDVAIAAAVLHTIALVTPIFFQLVIDKVLVHHSLSTLHVLGVGILVALVFDAALGFLRSYLLAHATAKIDVRLAMRTFNHLLSLPIAFFERSPAGVLAKHMQQVGTIREFLTGRLFSTLIDASALFVFLPVLFVYSAGLTAVVGAFSLVMAGVIGVASVPFRRRLKALYQAEGGRQALLVESLHGMATVKALALEPLQHRHWETRSAETADRYFEVGTLGAGARAVSSLLEKLMMVAIVWLGALAVFDGQITVGELVAFNMLAGRVSGPLVQLVSLIQDYQQAALSVRMLGEVMNARPETGAGRKLQPAITGRLQFEDVGFRYPGRHQPALDRVRFEIPAGTTLGVVGRSGSGKTTLTRLIQGFYPVQEGLIRLDGIDLREIDMAHLRRNTGVVMQDSFLFRGTVRENIAVTRPEAPFEAIVRAARLAGAQEFIERLPEGYDTVLEEGAVNLSGGQKQRLAIARALLRDPPILIFDEATSALDLDSEAAVLANLAAIVRGRTGILISHRLSFLRTTERILVLDDGRVIDFGLHGEVLKRCAVYQHLWRQQTPSR
ncbi:MAG: peptidase domain-containing ABC transporter [Pseudomonadota bacterium]